MKTTQQFALTFVVLSLLGSRAAAAISSTDEIFTRITTGRIVTDGGQSSSAAAVDYDGDGWPDIYVGNGGGGSDAPNFLYRNNGDGTFARTNVAGVATDLGKTVTAAWGDYDNDGFPDLVVAHWPNQKNFQYRNNGDGQFTKITQGPIVSDAGSIDGCVWGDYDRDGWLDLFVAMYSGNHRLYHNNRDGTFSRTADLPTVGAASYPAWVDYDNDDFPDLFVPAWSSGKNALYHNNGNGTFTLITNSPLSSEGGLSISTTWGDYDNDGFPDLFVANGNYDGGQYQNFLYHNSGDGTFTKITTGAIATGTGDSTGAAWGDVDNDGDLDLLVINAAGQNEFFYLNNGDGTFTKITQGNLVNSGGTGNGAVFTDYDRDGFLDLFVADYGGNNWLFRNKGNSNGWLTVKCVGTVSNRSAIGAKVQAKATIGGKTFWQLREISNGDGLGSGTLTAHFGLGDAAKIETLRIEWPSGIVQELHGVSAKQSLTVTEPARLEQTALTSTLVSPTTDAISDSAGKILDASSAPATLIFNPGWDLRCVNQPVPIRAPSGAQVTWSDWTKVSGQADIKCVEKTDAAGKKTRGTEVHAKLQGLIPNGVYTFWVLVFGDPGFEPKFAFQNGQGGLGLPDGSENRFVASASGALEFTAFHPAGALSQFGDLPGCLADQYEVHLWAAYHPDGKTYGPFPGPLVPGNGGLFVEDSCVFATQFYFEFAHNGPPTLNIEQAVLVSWASLDGGGSYVVESAARVNGPWEATDHAVTEDGIWLRVTVPTSDQAKFFRLAKKP